MKKIMVLLSVLALTIGNGCKDEKKEGSGPSQMEKVMAVHDELMPKMGTISKLVAELNTKTDSTETGMAYEKAKKDLQVAHQDMMDWMKDIGDRFDYEEIMKGKELSEEKEKWLQEEELKIEDLKRKINSSIEKAEALLRAQRSVPPSQELEN
ncbi:MAG: hypothetical protein V7724_09160 [Sediminicola sp.]|tara:strand:- start:117994 stop:118452 length:459 start_codon:yes stop_codon:yes gene_type:complete